MTYPGEFQLKEVMDIELLQNIQEKLAEVTGLAFVTVDFKGEPITEETNFSEFCIARRKISDYKKMCYFSDAHAGLEAAIRRNPYIYRCPAGLVDFAIPIVVKGQYLGAVLCGQVRCSTGHEFLGDDEFIKCDSRWKMDRDLEEKYQKTMFIEHEKIISVSQLVYMVVNQLVEKEVINIIQDELNRKNVNLVEEKKARVELEKELKIAELKSLKTQMNPHFLFNVLNSIACSALIEGAKKTQEMTYLFSQLLKYNIEKSDKPVYIKEDMENIERYLKIQKVRFADKLNYSITIQEGLEDQKLPPLIIQPFVENAINHGIVPKETNGTIKLEVYSENGDIVVRIQDDGVGIPEGKIDKIFSFNQEKHGGSSIGIGIQNTRKRLMYIFGPTYDVNMVSHLNMGTSVKIKIPKDFEEGLI